MCEICSVLMNIARAFALAAPCFNMTWRSTTTSSSTPGSRSRAARTAAATRSCSYGAGYPGLSKAGYGIEVDFGGTWEWVNNLVVDTLGVPFTSTTCIVSDSRHYPFEGALERIGAQGGRSINGSQGCDRLTRTIRRGKR
jgi:hypothetical protein